MLVAYCSGTIPSKPKVRMEFNYMTSGPVWGDKDYIIRNAYTRFYMVVYGDPRTSSRRSTYLSVYAIGTCPIPLYRAKFELADGETSEVFDRCAQELGLGKKTNVSNHFLVWRIVKRAAW